LFGGFTRKDRTMTDSMNRVARTEATGEAEREAWWAVVTARAQKVKAVAEWAAAVSRATALAEAVQQNGSWTKEAKADAEAAAVRMADADEALKEAMVLARTAGDADTRAWLEEEATWHAADAD